MEESHTKHKDTIPQLDLSVVTGSQSFIAHNKGKSPKKQVDQ